MASAGELHEARREARVEAAAFTLAAALLLVALGVTSLMAGWELLGIGGWVWFVLAIPEAFLVVAELVSAARADSKPRRRRLQVALGFVVASNIAGLSLLVAGLLTEKTADLTGAQLLTSGAVVWLINVFAFGLWFWTRDCGGPIARAKHGRAKPDFQFPQDENPELARSGWYPRLEDYVYVGFTNAIAFSPTDAMPLTRSAKTLMSIESLISVVALLIVGARAVNVLGNP
jgi:small-conductance mechanosensitive channel